MKSTSITLSLVLCRLGNAWLGLKGRYLLSSTLTITYFPYHPHGLVHFGPVTDSVSASSKRLLVYSSVPKFGSPALAS
ncbi:hypothetical protein BJY52DRAFT_1302530, partial [Lactarius psammicola]